MNNDTEKLSKHSTVYDRMIGNLGDFMAKVQEESPEDSSLFSALKKTDERYSIGKSLARGGMKEIFEVEDYMTGRPVAKAVMKNLETNEVVEQFIQEARITARLEHPNIMPVYDIGIDASDQAYFTMKLVKGDNLGDILLKLRENDKQYIENYPLIRLLDIYTKICDAVAYAHNKGILHLDLKPANIQVGSFGEVLVCDWGLSRFNPDFSTTCEAIEYRSGELTLFGAVCGSPGFMSPEQVMKKRDELDWRSDIYSLGCILYAVLTLERPFAGKQSDVILQATADNNFIIPSKKNNKRYIPPALEAVCLHSMQYYREKRYQSVRELKGEINAYTNGFATYAENAGVWTLFLLLCRRHRSLVILSSLIFVLSVCFSLIYLNKEEENQRVSAKLGQKEREKEKVSQELQVKSKQNESLNEALEVAKNKFLSFTDNIHIYKGFNNIINGNFSLAVQNFKDSKKTSFDSYAQICNEISTKRTPGERSAVPRALLLKLVSLMQRDLYTSLLEQLLLNEAQFLSDAECLDLCQEVLQIMNPHSAQINLSYTTVLGKKSLSLANNASVNSISALALLPVHLLDLSGTQVSNINVLRYMPLVSLELESTKVKDLSPLQELPLKHLDLKNTKLTELKSLENSKLESLNLYGYPLEDLQLLKFLPYLKTLVLEENSATKMYSENYQGKVKIELLAN